MLSCSGTVGPSTVSKHTVCVDGVNISTCNRPVSAELRIYTHVHACLIDLSIFWHKVATLFKSALQTLYVLRALAGSQMIKIQ